MSTKAGLIPDIHSVQSDSQLPAQLHPPTAPATIKNLHMATDQIVDRDDEQRHVHECEDPEAYGQPDPQVLAAAFQYAAFS